MSVAGNCIAYSAGYCVLTGTVSWGVLDSEDIQYGCASGLAQVATPDGRIDLRAFLERGRIDLAATYSKDHERLSERTWPLDEIKLIARPSLRHTTMLGGMWWCAMVAPYGSSKLVYSTRAFGKRVHEHLGHQLWCVTLILLARKLLSGIGAPHNQDAEGIADE